MPARSTAHPFAAAAAAAITVAASASSAIATRPVTRPVAGLVTSPQRPLSPSYLAPATQCGIVVLTRHAPIVSVSIPLRKGDRS